MGEIGASVARALSRHSLCTRTLSALRTSFSYDDECGPRFGERHELVLIDPGGSEATLFEVGSGAAATRFLDASGDGSRLVINDGSYFRLLDNQGAELRRFDTE